MSETKAAIAERTIQSLKNTLYRYMEDNANKYIHKLTQLVRILNSRRNCLIELIPKKKNPDLLFIVSSQPLREFTNTKFEKMETEFSSRSMTQTSDEVIGHNLWRRFLKLLQFLPKNQKTSHIRNKP